MTINIERKQITFIVISIIIVCIAICGISAIRKISYKKNAKQCQESIHQLYYTSSLLSSEIHSTWRDYIFDNKKYFDKETGRFYVSERKHNLPEGVIIDEYCSNFSEAIFEKSNYYKNKGIHDIIDTLYHDIKESLQDMTPAPKKFTSLHQDLQELFHTAEAMYFCATSPEGNLQSYTSSINDLSSEYKRKASNIDIQIGEIDESKRLSIESSALSSFL